MANTALYYPYMRIEDEGWLKATLLLFDQVQRIVPTPEVSGDSEKIKTYIRTARNGSPLLGPAPLYHDKVRMAQERLASQIEEDARTKKFRDRFSEDRTLRERPADDQFGFQMHQGKLAYNLRKVLTDRKLAWVPDKREIYDVDAQYVAMHPVLGEAIMSTLATACALTEGARIVGDERSGPLHEHLQSLKVDDIYEGLIHRRRGGPTRQATPHQLFEVVVGLACDTSEVGPQQLAQLGEDRQAIAALLETLSTHASSIGSMYEGEKREDAFREHAMSILAAWRSDAANMANYTKRLLGINLIDPGKDAMTKLIEGAFTVATPSVAGSEAATHASHHGPVVQLAAGVAVGLLAHGVKTYVEMRNDARNSPYRYLTAMRKAGVVFRREIKSKP